MTMKRVGALALGVAALMPAMSFAADKAAAAMKLSTQDYIDIQQLVEGYPYMIDNCTNSGYDYADQYTNDAVFGVASEWNSPAATKIWYRGREELADAAGGGKGGCRPKPVSTTGVKVHHIQTSLVITATATGATGKCTLLATGAGGNPLGIEWQGGYQDEYVKTATGWKFKSRLHVWPGFDWPNTPAEMAKRRADAEKKAAEEKKK
jgi:hypothetical protein